MMKRFCFAAICSLAIVGSSQATINIEIDAGLLKTFNGGANVPVNGLLQLITSPSGSAANFAAPTSTSFVGGDNIVVASFAMNYNVQAGETDNQLLGIVLGNTGTSSSTTFDAGDPLLLRWYPNLTYSGTLPAGPGANQPYGQFRTDTSVDGGSPWITPTDGLSRILVLATTSAGGSQPNALGFANSAVPVPEPSSIAAILAMGVGAVGIAARRRKS